MTRQPHDRYAKQLLAGLLEPLGEAQTSFDIADESRQIDVYFVPHEPPDEVPELLSLLARIASRSCALEVFRNPPSPAELRTCQLKLYALHARLDNDAEASAEDNLPLLWVVSPTLSQSFRDGCGARDAEGWPGGVYRLPEQAKTMLVAVHQLPVEPSTLLLRTLGRGRVQRAAAAEVARLPASEIRAQVMKLLTSWRTNVELRQNRTRDEEEVIVNLSPAYLEWEAEQREIGRREGEQRGEQRGIQVMVENLLRSRFGDLDGDLDNELAAIVPKLAQLDPADIAPLVLSEERDRLLARFGK